MTLTDAKIRELVDAIKLGPDDDILDVKFEVILPLCEEVLRLREAVRSHVRDLSKHWQPAPNMEGTFTGPPSVARTINRLLAAIGDPPLRTTDKEVRP